MRFNPGDKVTLNKLASIYYSITKEGSFGVVEKMLDDKSVFIHFQFTTGIVNSPSIFVIDIECVEFLSSADSIDAKYSHVIRKMKQMDERRKGLGYAF